MVIRETKDVGVQTDKNFFETRQTKESDVESSAFGLQSRVFRWTHQDGDLILWNHAINNKFQKAVTSGGVVQLRGLKKDLELRTSTGYSLLEMMNCCRLSGPSKGIQPGQARDFEKRIEMVSEVSKGIGILEGWLTMLTTKLEPFDYDAVLEYDSEREED